MNPIWPKQDTQAYKILMKLIEADGEWVSGSVFLRQLYLSQFHARIYELENDMHWNIEHSDFTDEHSFVSYRLASEPKQSALFEVPVPRLSRLDLVR